MDVLERPVASNLTVSESPGELLKTHRWAHLQSFWFSWFGSWGLKICLSKELLGYWCCWFRGPHIGNHCSRYLPNSVFLGGSQLCISNLRCDDFSYFQRPGSVGRQERVWTAWASWASSEEICDANDLLVFSWEQKGFQYGEPNRIHYLTISSKLMQDYAARTCSKEEGPWQLEMGRIWDIDLS